jgi:hypothetical protein
MTESHQQSMPTHPAAASVASPLALAFVTLAGMIAWAVHFWLGFILVEIACRTDFPGFSLAGLSGLQVLLLAVTLVFGGVTLAAAVTAFRINRRADVGVASDRDGPRELAGFMAQTGLVLSGFFLLAIVIAAAPAFILPPCG